MEGMVDIDAELAEDALEAEEEEEEPEAEPAGAAHARGAAGEDFDYARNSHGSEPYGVGGRPASEQVSRAVSTARQFEDVSQLSEEELRERVRRSIEELIPPDTVEAVHSGAGGGAEHDADAAPLTPAQVFYLENREKLVGRAQEYYLEKQREQQLREAEGVPEEVEDEWRYYHDPVVRPAKGHLWSTGENGDQEAGTERDWLMLTQDWPRGQLPTVDMIVDLLRSEQARDIVVCDLNECNRRDLGTHGIVCTGITAAHCRRLGEIVSKAVSACKAPHVEAYCFGTRRDEWVVAYCGPIKVHMFTRDTREQYQLQLLWEQPENFFQPGDFPHYVEVYGMATEAFALSDGYVTQASGSRSTTYLPPPFQDRLNTALMKPDYDAAADAQYVTPGSRPLDVQGEVLPHQDASRPDWRTAGAPAAAASAEDGGAVFREGLGAESDTDSEAEDDLFPLRSPDAPGRARSHPDDGLPPLDDPGEGTSARRKRAVEVLSSDDEGEDERVREQWPAAGPAAQRTEGRARRSGPAAEGAPAAQAFRENDPLDRL